ncbi:unnamed protein product [Colias eurytheme]|nr:unnamed protein product [Colias eurytheme]
MHDLLEKLQIYGVGRRKLNDELFANEKPIVLGVYDFDDEDLCHEVIKSTCSIPGCNFTTTSLLDFENHYNSHRYSCCECKRVLPSPHLLDLHVQEAHDSFFAVSSLRKPSYCCYIEECKEKFMNPDERLDHCVKVHKLPKDFRFDQKPKAKKQKKNSNAMEIDANSEPKKFVFTNNKQRSFKYTGKKFTKDEKSGSSVNMDTAMSDLKESLPE